MDHPPQHPQAPRRRRKPILKAGVALAALAFAASLAAIALASSGATVESASNSALGERVLVSAQGRTLYVLSPETAHHLLCKSSECLKFWPPLTVASTHAKLAAGSGVQGRLGVLRRSDGLLQVTLDGQPLYRFAGDHASGEANGQDLKSFGGTWHVLTAGGMPSAKAPASSSSAAAAPAPGGESQPASSPTPSWPGY